VRGHMRRRGDARELRAYVGPDPTTGRQKYRTKTFRVGKREAEGELARFVTHVAGGGYSAGDTTLADLIQRWLALSRDDLSPSTLRGYERIIRSYILPNIGQLRLNKLRTDHLERFYMKLRESGGEEEIPLSPATVRQTHAIVSASSQPGASLGLGCRESCGTGFPAAGQGDARFSTRTGQGARAARRSRSHGPRLGAVSLACRHHGS
jgi:Phage integrase, N-terminal SAM-like domain